ncbi:MAG: hypothetical protein K0R52_1407 [Alphaproteobacteria bacterium]|jgi:hypothetical protein|nr:hypothetical protein [Alphaproteobacteria bacterium]
MDASDVAISKAGTGTTLDEKSFPQQCPYTFGMMRFILVVMPNCPKRKPQPGSRQPLP